MAFAFSYPLDQQFLESLYEDDLVYASEVFAAFLKNTRIDLEEVKNSYSSNDLKKLRQHLHKMKPTFGFVGLTGLTERTESLISACDTSAGVKEVEPQYNDLIKEIEGSFGLIETELERMKTHM